MNLYYWPCSIQYYIKKPETCKAEKIGIAEHIYLQER